MAVDSLDPAYDLSGSDSPLSSERIRQAASDSVRAGVDALTDPRADTKTH